jgi:hypothetical protein
MLGGQPKADVASGGGRVSSISPNSTVDQVKAFTADLDQALARMDRNKLKAVVEKNAVEPEAVTPAAVPVRRPAAISVKPPVEASEDPIPTALILERLELPLPGMTTVPSPSDILATPNQSLPIFETATTEEAGPLTFDDLTAPAVVELPPVELALEAVRARVTENPNLVTALALNLLEQAEGKTPDPAVAKNLSPNDQKLLQDLAAALQSMTGAGNPTVPLAERAAPLLDAAKKWAPAAMVEQDLHLPTLALASRVDSYGVYHKLDPKFPVGKKQTVIIYCEVANFVPKKSPDGWFETNLTQQETLATDDGLLLWRPNPEDVQDRSQKHRRDFYLVKKLTIPDNIPVGKYALRMSVTDKNTNKIAVVTLPIEIVR